MIECSGLEDMFARQIELHAVGACIIHEDIMNTSRLAQRGTHSALVVVRLPSVRHRGLLWWRWRCCKSSRRSLRPFAVAVIFANEVFHQTDSLTSPPTSFIYPVNPFLAVKIIVSYSFSLWWIVIVLKPPDVCRKAFMANPRDALFSFSPSSC